MYTLKSQIKLNPSFSKHWVIVSMFFIFTLYYLLLRNKYCVIITSHIRIHVCWHSKVNSITFKILVKWQMTFCLIKSSGIFYLLFTWLYGPWLIKEILKKYPFLGGFNEQSLVILWVNWFKNESFWHRFTCT